MRKKVVPSPELRGYIRDLNFTLVRKGYFSSLYYARIYTKELLDYIRQNAAIAPKKSAPAIFQRYGKNLLYFTYNRSAQTTWYIFLEETETAYWIRHITNSHVAGQHFNPEN